MADPKQSAAFDAGIDSKEINISAVDTQASSDVDSESQQWAKIKPVQRKVDRRLVFWYSFVYLIMRIHVGNISNTAIMNEESNDDILDQLHLSSGQWAWCLSIFYYSYGGFEPFSTLLLKRFKPNIWMARIMITWGIISMCQGATQNYAGLLVCRFFLGLAEAGYYPGVLYHLSFWYPADCMALRIAFFYACGQFSGTISGLLAYAISFMNGLCGLAGWRWMFILEGIPIILCGIYTLFMLPNYPDEKIKFLSAEELQIINDSVPKSQPKGYAKTWNTDQVKALFKDPTFPTFSLIWIFHAIGGWGISLVLPTVIYELGLTDTAIAQLMTMPAYTVGCTFLILIGWLIHKKKVISWVAAICLEVFACVCYIILINVQIPAVKYVFVTLALSCSISIYPIIWPERIRAAQGTTATGLAIGITNACAQLNGIVGPQVYNLKFGPEYKVSFAVSIALLAGAIASISATWYLVAKQDRKRRDNVVLEQDQAADNEAVLADKNI